jgi:transcriptional regulator with XRE-family HTH domain
VADNELGAYLATRRALMSPLDIGKNDGTRRRVPGLRRSEVADRAGISVEYYTELEQGRGRRPSEQVLTALARMFRLDRDERAYLFGLAGIFSPPPRGSLVHVDAALLDLLDKLTGIPAQIFTDLYELIAQNALAGALLGASIEPPDAGGTSVAAAWFLSPGAARARYLGSETAGISAAYVADLRASAGRRPHDTRLAAMITRLRADSPEFTGLWDEAAVEVRRSGRHQVIHPSLGAIEVECTSMLNEDGTQRLVWYSPRIGGKAVQQLQLLSVLENAGLG